MNAHRLLAPCLALAFFAPAPLAPAQNGGKAEPKPIVFRRGAASATLSGSIRDDWEAEYAFDAREKQFLRVTITSRPNLACVPVLRSPDRTVVEMEQETDHEWVCELPATGTYELDVKRASADKGAATYRLTVAIR